jgi:hypothetical protein
MLQRLRGTQLSLNVLMSLFQPWVWTDEDLLVLFSHLYYQFFSRGFQAFHQLEAAQTRAILQQILVLQSLVHNYIQQKQQQQVIAEAILPRPVWEMSRVE